MIGFVTSIIMIMITFVMVMFFLPDVARYIGTITIEAMINLEKWVESMEDKDREEETKKDE